MIADRVSVEVGSVIAMPAEIEGKADRIQVLQYQSGSMLVSNLVATLAMNEQYTAARAAKPRWPKDATAHTATTGRKRDFLHHSPLLHTRYSSAHLSPAEMS